MTPYELKMAIEAYNENRKVQEQEMLIQAYLTAVWVRCKRMPNINKVLGIEQKKTKMTSEEILEEVKKLNQSMGGTTY